MESIWTATTQMPHFPPLRGDARTDVLVIGGGMAGLLCAHQLQKAGVSCIVAEAKTIASGVTGNTTAKITAQHGLCYQKLLKQFGPERTRLYLEANLNALNAYRSLCSGIDFDFTPQDSFIFSRDDRQALEAELDALTFIGYPAEFAENLPLPFPTVGAVKFPGQAQFHPLKLLSALAEELTIFENTPVRKLTRQTAITDRGAIHARAIIVATHFPFLNRRGGYFLKLYQQRSYVLSLKNAPKLTGMYLDAQENGLSFRSWGDTLILGGGGHRTGKQGGGWQELEDYTRKHYPGAAITHRWAAQDCMSLDGVPYIGRYSGGTPDLYVATGFNKWGMTSSMVAAQVLADLVQGKENPFALLFSPARPMPRVQLKNNVLESARNLLTPSVPRCPHMGCALKWNPQEHSWDCPCHGSRFEENGKLIDNPAVRDLKRPQ